MCGSKARDLYCHFLLFRCFAGLFFSLIISHTNIFLSLDFCALFFDSNFSFSLLRLLALLFVCCHLLSCFRTELLVPTIRLICEKVHTKFTNITPTPTQTHIFTFLFYNFGSIKDLCWLFAALFFLATSMYAGKEWMDLCSVSLLMIYRLNHTHI